MDINNVIHRCVKGSVAMFIGAIIFRVVGTFANEVICHKIAVAMLFAMLALCVVGLVASLVRRVRNRSARNGKHD